MSIGDIDGKSIIVGLAIAALTSTVGYIFYGHIELSAEVKTIKTEQEQHSEELIDLWDKHNKGIEEKFEEKEKALEDKKKYYEEQHTFLKEYYQTRIEDEQKWTEYYKKKSEE